MRWIDIDEAMRRVRETYCDNCERRKGMKKGKVQFVYDIGDVPCRACELGDTVDFFDTMPAIEWTSVSDGLPETKINKRTDDYEWVLCATTFGDVRPYKYGAPIGWEEAHFWHGAGMMDEYVTHWMPFPTAPMFTKAGVGINPENP